MKSEVRNNPDAEFDTTSCRHGSYERRVHRDYIAHVFRWGWATRFIDNTSSVLEPGCGVDSQLYVALRESRNVQQRPRFYVGVDLNKINVLRKRNPDTRMARSMVLLEEFNFVTRWSELLETYGAVFDVAASFEVIEHMTEAHGDSYLRGIHELLAPGGKLLLSTPVFNGRAAKNHIREYTIAELDAKLKRAGFEVADRFGTFASYPDIKRALKELENRDEAELLTRVLSRAREFYGDEVLSCYLAPLFPDHSRNNAWVAVKR